MIGISNRCQSGDRWRVAQWLRYCEEDGVLGYSTAISKLMRLLDKFATDNALPLNAAETHSATLSPYVNWLHLAPGLAYLIPWLERFGFRDIYQSPSLTTDESHSLIQLHDEIVSRGHWPLAYACGAEVSYGGKAAFRSLHEWIDLALVYENDDAPDDDDNDDDAATNETTECANAIHLKATLAALRLPDPVTGFPDLVRTISTVAAPIEDRQTAFYLVTTRCVETRLQTIETATAILRILSNWSALAVKSNTWTISWGWRNVVQLLFESKIGRAFDDIIRSQHKNTTDNTAEIIQLASKLVREMESDGQLANGR